MRLRSVTRAIMQLDQRHRQPIRRRAAGPGWSRLPYPCQEHQIIHIDKTPPPRKLPEDYNTSSARYHGLQEVCWKQGRGLRLGEALAVGEPGAIAADRTQAIDYSLKESFGQVKRTPSKEPTPTKTPATELLANPTLFVTVVEDAAKKENLIKPSPPQSPATSGKSPRQKFTRATPSPEYKVTRKTADKILKII